MVTVTHPSTYSAHTDSINHLARVAVVPVLVHKLLLCYSVRTQLVVERLVVLCHSMTPQLNKK